MATASSPVNCSTCEEKIDIYDCRGCLKTFCFQCLSNHREAIKEGINQLQDNCNLFRENINDQRSDVNNRQIIKYINQWEIESIGKIKQVANISRIKIINYTNDSIIEIEKNLNYLSEQSRKIRKEDKLNEILLNQLNEKLEKFKEELENLKKELDQPANFLVEQQEKLTSFIHKIDIRIPRRLDKKWKQQGLTVAGGNGKGELLNQLSCPLNIAIDDNEIIYIVDHNNHRIVEWKSNETKGRIVAGGNGKGDQKNQLNKPTDLVIDQEYNSLIIADCGNRRVIQWSCGNNITNGEVIISDIYCARLTIDKDGSLYVSD